MRYFFTFRIILHSIILVLFCIVLYYDDLRLFPNKVSTPNFCLLALLLTVNSPLSPPGGLFISSTLEGSLLERGLIREGGLINFLIIFNS